MKPAPLSFLLVCGVLILCNCTRTVTVYEPGSDGRYHKVGTFTEEEGWKRDINQCIAREKAGTLQKASYETVKQYWQSRYSGIRSAGDPSWKGSDLKTAEDMVAYIKQKRREAGLPAY